MTYISHNGRLRSSGREMQPRRLDAQLPPVTGLRQRDVADVVLEIEVLVLDPLRMIQAERHVRQLLPERTWPDRAGSRSAEGSP